MLRKAARIVIAVFLIAGAAHAALAEKRVALVIGNSAYSLAPLDNPKNDADDVAAALKRLHFDVAERKDLTVREFDQAIDAFEAAAKDADVAFFFFSGHGVQIDKRGFIAPVDLKAESESSALRELVAIPDVVSRIENTVRVSVIVLDACRDSPLQERLRRIAVEKNKAAMPPKGLPPISVVGSNTLIVYATVPGETASDGAGQRNSPFTAALLKNIETPGLEIELIFKRVTADVVIATGGRQQPERLSRLQNELVLAPSAPEKAQPPVIEAAARVWALIKDMKDIAVFEAFKTQFGPSAPVYDTLAAQKIVELKRAQVAVVAPPKLVVSGDACDGLLVSVATGARSCIRPGSGESFKDCPDCPEMVVVPAGTFVMGSPESEPERERNATQYKGSESPQHKVTISKPFAAGKFAVTFAEWSVCETDGCGGHTPNDKGWGRDDRPVINVSWGDAKAYVAWLSKKTGKSYRLLSEAEREYVTRAGTHSPFWWGYSINPKQANYDGSVDPYEGGGEKGEYRQKTVPVKSFNQNPWGLYQVHGNVWEWVEDCWNGNYNAAPSDGSAWIAGDCNKRVLRGGSWHDNPWNVRSAIRIWEGTGKRTLNFGFRVARTLD